MLLAQVEGFVAIAAESHLGRAARVLRVTQPALTARLQQLERELGAQLFERSRRGMRLTPAGQAFLPFAQRALEALEEGHANVDGIVRGEAGELRIGTAPALGAYVLPDLLARYARTAPGVRLIVRTGHSEEILALVVSGEVDVALIRELHHPQVETRHLYLDELVFVVPPGHPFADAGWVPVERIGETRLVLFDRTSSYYALTSAAFRAAGVAPQEVLELDNIEAAKQMVRAGLGVALLPMTAVKGDLSHGQLRAVRLEGIAPIRPRMVAATSMRPAATTPALALFMRVLFPQPGGV